MKLQECAVGAALYADRTRPARVNPQITKAGGIVATAVNTTSRGSADDWSSGVCALELPKPGLRPDADLGTGTLLQFSEMLVIRAHSAEGGVGHPISNNGGSGRSP